MHDSENNGNSREVIFSKAVKAGKRTYFFDVKSTRANDYFVTITESKKKFNMGDDKPFYEKHKIFLYKEDFEKFMMFCIVLSLGLRLILSISSFNSRQSR